MYNTASKHAIMGLTKNGAAELGKYAVSLSGVATALTFSYMKQGNASSASEVNKADAGLYFEAGKWTQTFKLESEHQIL
uniref:Uncharacterized protein n=1 Tax=Picea sitchensis TaxID=3332 RepID=A9NSP8_PICSI|nr:unknown [Picea sitchensis]